MGVISYLYSRAWYLNLRAYFIDFIFRLCISFPQTLSSHSNSACLHLDLLCFCSNCTLALRYIAAYRFLVFQLKTISSHSGCFCALVKCLLSDFCCDFLCNNPVKIPQPGVLAGAFALLIRASRKGGNSLVYILPPSTAL